jgi:hypothetical protein
MSKRLIALPVAMLAVAVFAPGIANATNFNTSATIAIKGAAGTSFGGTVNSSRSQCKSARAVSLQRKSPGSANFVKIGGDQSASNGAWVVNTNPVSGAQYRAQVAAKKIGANTCRAATSTTVTARKTTNTIAITPLGASFKGTVASSNTNCVNGRTVTLQRKLPGGAFQNLNNDATGSNGAWEVATNPVNNAQYKGFVSAKQVGSNSCMAVNSPVTTAHNSTLTIAQGGSSNFHGNVNSVAACEPNRTVTLQRKTIYETTFHNLGSDVTNSAGAWQKSTAVVSGASYRASVSAKQAGANSCLDDLSNTIVAS